MCRLKEALKHFCCARVQSNKYRHVKFYISGADVSDEGEIKIIRYIHALNRQYRNNSYLIVGSDADLILLGSLQTILFHSLFPLLTAICRYINTVPQCAHIYIETSSR